MALTAKKVEEFRKEFQQTLTRKEVYSKAKMLMEWAKLETNPVVKGNFITLYKMAMEVWREKTDQKGVYSLREESQVQLLDLEVKKIIN